MAKGERAFVSLDQDLRVVHVGPRALSVWGKSSRDVVGRSLTEVFPAADGSPMHHGLLEALHTLRRTRIETDVFRPGQHFEVEIYPLSGMLQVSFWPIRR